MTFNGIAHTAAYVSASQLTISLTSTDLATVGIYPVVVTNPAPGGGASSPANFTVTSSSSTNSEWAWVSGSSTGGGAGVYGSLGVPSASNVPGERVGATSWTDGNGNLWLFGGYGVNQADIGGYLNDLWEFNPTAKTWTWVTGANTPNQTGVYGTQGIPATSNSPGARESAVGWMDGNGNLWLFAGVTNSAGNTEHFNDLWEFNPTAKTWTWIAGASTSNQAGVYGTQGTPSTTNAPGARDSAVSWIDGKGNLWCFGGYGVDSTGSSGYLNDLWEYSPTAKTWTWVAGVNTSNQAGVYGTQGTSATTNAPGARYQAASWIDSNGDLWLFGGYALDSQGNDDFFNDLWEFNPTAKTWTWVTGANTPNQTGVYGTQGTPASTNVPGARYSAVTWVDGNSNFWLFGGGAGSSQKSVFFSDLWEFNPTAKTWTWVNGPDMANQLGAYGAQGIPTVTNIPGGRDFAVGWIDGGGNFWLFGGDGIDSTGLIWDLNDLWRFQSTIAPPTITSVSVTCSPASILTTQTSTCTPTVAGTEGYSTSVTWSVSPMTMGSVSNAGVFTPSAAGVATITATSTKDPTKFGSAAVAVAVPPTITSMSVSCSLVTVPTGQTSQCLATVSGTGNYSSAVNWSVNNVSGGNPAIGTIGPTGVFSAPSTVPTPFTESITATSVEDPTKAASASVIVAGTIASVSQPIVALSGGTVTLPDGSSVTIAPGTLPSNQTVTLSEVSYLPGQPPNAAVVGVGPGLVLTFGTPVPPLAQELQTKNNNASRESRNALTSTANTNTSAFQFSINTSNNNSPGLNGSVPAVDFVDSSGNNVFMGTSGNYDSTTAVVAGNIGTDQWNAFLVSTSNYVESIVVSAVNIVGYEASVGVRLLEVPNQLSLSINSSDSTKDAWVNYSSCPTGKTLVVVHGMNSYVQAAFPTDSADLTIQQILTAGGYQAALGFNYDWTQHIDSSGGQLAQFLNRVAACTAVTSIDIEAHSEGVPVSMAAWIPSAGLNSAAKAKIDHLIALGGPIMGTPMANDARWLGAFIMGASELDLGDNIVLDGLADLLTRPFVNDLQVSTPGNGDVLDDIRASLSPASIENAPQIVAVAGNAPQSLLLKTLANSMSIPPYNVASSDGFIPVASALAFQTGVVEGQELKAYPLAPFPVEHTNLVTDLNDTSTVGIFKSIGAQVDNAFASPSLAISSSVNCFDVVVCSDAQEAIFELSGNGYSTTQNDEFELFASGIVNSPPNPPPTFTAPDSSIPVDGWKDSSTCPESPQSVVFFAENMTTLQASNAVTEEVNSGACITSNPAPSIALLSPTSLTGGSSAQTLTIEGTGFIPLSRVTFNAIFHPAIYVSTSQLTIALTTADLATVGTYPVVVTNPAPGGGASSPASFTVTGSSGNPVPTITSLNPSSLPVGATPQTLTINGTGFLTSSTVTFSGVAHAPTYVSASQLTISLTTADLATEGTYPVIVTNASPGGGTSVAANFVVINPQTATEWTWIGGSNTVGAIGVYGTLGVPSASNVPGSRNGASSWIDSEGNFWLFGGFGSLGSLNDLWTFDPITENWTWVSGSSTADAAAVYGSQDVPATTNVPGARFYAVSWIDKNDKLWLFGGDGVGSNNVSGFLDDLWEFDPVAKTWTWVSGNTASDTPGVYGTVGEPSTGNVPGARYFSVSWIDSGGNLWLFGGDGWDSTGFYGQLNDLWEFNPTTLTWTWVGGASSVNVDGVYGTEGVPSISNWPGSRSEAVSWVDSSGNLWLFGGNGWNSSGGGTLLDDLWKFNPAATTWTWVSGSSTTYTANSTFSAIGVYGTEGVAAVGNTPGGRTNPARWIDANGNLWLFGGNGYASTATTGELNDLWEFNPGSGEWTWANGGNTTNGIGIYGTSGVSASTNVPGSRDYPVSWIDNNGYLWLLGGEGYDSKGTFNLLNDLWRYQPLNLTAPSIIGVNPTTFTAPLFGQTITIDGSNFQSGDTLSFVPPAGSAISSTPSNLTLHSGSQISYQFNDTIFVGGALGTWTVTVTNPDGQSSNTWNFTTVCQLCETNP